MKRELILSPSSLRSTPACKRALSFRYALRLTRSERSFPLALGAGIHLLLANYYNPEKKLQKEILEQKLREELNRSLPIGEEIDEAVQKAKDLFGAYIVAAIPQDRDESWQTLQVESRFKIELIPDIYIVGVVDWIGTTDWGKTIIDHKTASSCGPSYFKNLERDLQAIVYPWAAREYGFTPNCFGLNVIVKTKTPRIQRYYIPINWERVDWAIEGLRKEAEKFKALPSDVEDILQLPPNPTNCRWCPYYDICTAPDLDAAKWIRETEFVERTYDLFEGK